MALSLDHLEAQDSSALILAWEVSFTAPPPPSTSQDMMRLIVGWEIQAKRARADVRALKAAIGKGRRSGIRPASGAAPARLIKPRIVLSPGTRLSREWQGRTYSVDVLDKGFAYDGKLFTSLSPLGYDAIEKKLVINENEAKAVRRIYTRYADLKNVRVLKVELTKEGYISKQRVTKTGKASGGKPFERGALYTILKNPTYLGLTTHKGKVFDGEHVPIIDKALFEKVQSILSSNRQRDKHKSGAKNPSLLAGKIIAASGITLTPSHAQSKGRRYRYYVERRKDGDAVRAARPVRLPAAEIEASVQSTLIEFLRDPIRLMDNLQLSTAAQETQDAVRSKASSIADGMELAALPSNSTKSIRELIERIELSADAGGYKLTINIEALTALLELPIKSDLTDPIIKISLKLQTCNNGKRVIIGNTATQKLEPNFVLIEALKTAHVIRGRFMGEDPEPISTIAQELSLDVRQAWRTLKLAYLAPDMQLAILSGTQPIGLLLKDLIYQALPTAWPAQRKQLGFPA